MTELSVLLTTGDVAEALGFNRVTLWRLTQSGRGPVDPVARAGEHGTFLFAQDDVRRVADQLAADASERAARLAA